MTERTFFGLNVINGRGVRPADIACLPFSDFWCDSAVRSAQIKDRESGEWLVPLGDWKAFSMLFITRGRHRNMPEPPQVLWFDREDDEPKRTFFGVLIANGDMIREADIATLPFYDFWRKGPTGIIRPVDFKTRERFVYLHDWKTFSKIFVATGRHRPVPRTIQRKGA